MNTTQTSIEDDTFGIAEVGTLGLYTNKLLYTSSNSGLTAGFDASHHPYQILDFDYITYKEDLNKVTRREWVLN